MQNGDDLEAPRVSAPDSQHGAGGDQQAPQPLAVASIVDGDQEHITGPM